MHTPSWKAILAEKHFFHKGQINCVFKKTIHLFIKKNTLICL